MFEPLLRHVRDERELPRARDRDLQRALVLGAGAGNPARLDLAPLRQERRQQPDVLVVDVVDLLRAELADAAPAEEAATARRVARGLPPERQPGEGRGDGDNQDDMDGAEGQR